MAEKKFFMLPWLICFGMLCNGAFGARTEPGTNARVILASSSVPAPTPSSPGQPGTCKSRVEIFGYPCQEHKVTTEDGYILSLQRIPHGKKGSSDQTTKEPVLLQHGLLMDGITWLLNSADESLAYILADSGYDVWIANIRGTIYSQGHTSLSTNDPEYWDWSWDELVAYDLPATFNYVYSQSGHQKLHYVGHSLGTLMAFAYFSENNEPSILRSAALLSPIAYLDHVTSPLALGGADTFLAEAIFWLGLDEFNPNGKEVHNLLTALCKQPNINCYDLISALTGPNCCLNSSAVQVFLDHEPQATATKNMVHLAQMIRKGTITKYDYGDANTNIKYYGQATPPAYNVSGIRNDFPLFLSYGGKDELSDVKDVEHLREVLKSHQHDKLTVQYTDDYAHADFVMAVNAKAVVYDSLIAFFGRQ